MSKWLNEWIYIFVILVEFNFYYMIFALYTQMVKTYIKVPRTRIRGRWGFLNLPILERIWTLEVQGLDSDQKTYALATLNVFTLCIKMTKNDEKWGRHMIWVLIWAVPETLLSVLVYQPKTPTWIPGKALALSWI